MQNVMNRRWLLNNYPEGIPSLENWTLDAQPVPTRMISMPANALRPSIITLTAPMFLWALIDGVLIRLVVLIMRRTP